MKTGPSAARKGSSRQVYRELVIDVLCFAVACFLALSCNDLGSPIIPPKRAVAVEPLRVAPKGHFPEGAFPSTHENAPSLALCVAGDVLPIGALRRDALTAPNPATGLANMLSAALRRCGSGSLRVVNLETPVSARLRHSHPTRLLRQAGLDPASWSRSRSLRSELEPRQAVPLNAPTWVLDGLLEAGVDVLTLANNHALDQGRAGLSETIRAARRRGLVVTGAGFGTHQMRPVVYGSGTESITLLSYLERDAPARAPASSVASISVLPSDSNLGQLEEQIAEAPGHTVVQIHVVSELRERPRPRWRRLARSLAEAGADAVLFHGSHVIGPIDTIQVGDRSVLVAYGLGNLASDMGLYASARPAPGAGRGKWFAAETRSGLLARLSTGADRSLVVDFIPTWVAVEATQTPSFKLTTFCPGAASAPPFVRDPSQEALFFLEQNRVAALLGGFGRAGCSNASGEPRTRPRR